MTKQTNAAEYYKNAFKAWPTKQVGRKPTADELATIHALGARPGKQALACALMLRDVGVTGAQIVMACGAPQLNKARDMKAKGLVKRVPISNTAEGHTVYRIALTAKGEGKAKAAATPAKAKPVKQPGNVDIGNAKPVETPVDVPAPQA